MVKSIEELDTYISQYIQGGFWANDMRVLKEEIEKLEPGDVYVEIGVDEGRSARTAHEYAHPEVFKFFIDIHDPTHTPNLNRAEFMEQEGMVGLGKKGFFIHGDADEFVDLFYSICEHGDEYDNAFIDLIFIDGHHGYEDVKKNTLMWEPWVKKGGVILFHDIDYTDGVPKWLDDHYGKGNWENLHGKIGRVRK